MTTYLNSKRVKVQIKRRRLFLSATSAQDSRMKTKISFWGMRVQKSSEREFQQTEPREGAWFPSEVHICARGCQETARRKRTCLSSALSDTFTTVSLWMQCILWLRVVKRKKKHFRRILGVSDLHTDVIPPPTFADIDSAWELGGRNFYYYLGLIAWCACVFIRANYAHCMNTTGMTAAKEWEWYWGKRGHQERSFVCRKGCFRRIQGTREKGRKNVHLSDFTDGCLHQFHGW